MKFSCNAVCEYEYIHYHCYNLHSFPESIRILEKYLSYVKMCYAIFCYSGVKEQRQNYFLACIGASRVTQTVKNLPVMWETQVQTLGQEDPLEKGMATHSSILCLENPMYRGAWWATCSPWGRKRVRDDWTTNSHFHFHRGLESHFLIWGLCFS